MSNRSISIFLFVFLILFDPPAWAVRRWIDFQRLKGGKGTFLDSGPGEEEEEKDCLRYIHGYLEPVPVVETIDF